MSSSSDEDMRFTPDSMKMEAEAAINNILPEISKERYLKTYNEFMKWRTEKRVKSLSETVFLTYFSELSKKLQPSSLWCIYSMLKATMSTKHDINIKNFSKLSSFLKRQSAGHKSKKSKVFTAQDVKTFINEAPDDIYLAMKVRKITNL